MIFKQSKMVTFWSFWSKRLRALSLFPKFSKIGTFALKNLNFDQFFRNFRQKINFKLFFAVESDFGLKNAIGTIWGVGSNQFTSGTHSHILAGLSLEKNPPLSHGAR